MLFLLIAQEQFKPEYTINENGVVLNPTIAYEVKVNGSTFPQVTIEYAETTFERKVFQSQVNLSTQGYGRPITYYSILKSKSFKDCLEEVIDYISQSVTVKDKKVLQQIHKDLTKTITKWKT